MQDLTRKVKQKMRLGELKRAVKNTRDIDHYLNQLETRLETMMKELKQRSDDLDVSMKYRFDVLRRELDAKVQDLIAKTPIYLDAGRFAMFSSPFGNLVVPADEGGLISFLILHKPEEIEPGTRLVIRRHLKPGDIAVDVGANIGLHMITMGQSVGKEGQVFAFEPTPNLAKALRHTALLSGLRHAKIVPQLVMDRNGPHKLYSFGHSPENSIFAVFDADSAHLTSVDVKACTLDHFFPVGSQVDFVKIDVEGAEPLVWAGMQRLIQENPRMKIILEMSPEHFTRSGIDLDAFYEDIRSHGFQVLAIDEDTGYTESVTVETIRTFTTLNVLLTREE
jgi:FkbM family methyltransferase